MYIILIEASLTYIQSSVSQKQFPLSLYVFMCMTVENTI